MLYEVITITEPMGQFLYKLAQGKDFQIQTKKGFQVGAFIVVPPFPYQDRKTFNLFSKDAVVVVKKEMKEGLHPMHLKCIENEWLITGDSGVPLLVTGTGITMKDAQHVMYKRINNVIVNNGYYRTVITSYSIHYTKLYDRCFSWLWAGGHQPPVAAYFGAWLLNSRVYRFQKF